MATQPAPDPKLMLKSVLPGTKVLLVDDFLDAREMYESYLEHAGFIVLTAHDAAAALGIARTEYPDIILMDAGLPGMSGWDAVRILKADARLLHIPVLMLTGHVLEESRQEAERAGADGFISKPCLPDDLVAEIRHALGLGGPSQSQEELRSRTAVPHERRVATEPRRQAQTDRRNRHANVSGNEPLTKRAARKTPKTSERTATAKRKVKSDSDGNGGQ